MENFRFAYLTLCFIFGIVWVLIYIKRPDLRKEQILMSVIVALLGLSEPLFASNYFKPQYVLPILNSNIGLEIIVLNFFYGGIAATIYEYVFVKGLKHSRVVKAKERRAEMFIALASGGILFFSFLIVLQFNIIFATSIELFGMGFILLYFRHDLILPSFVSGMIMGLLAFIALLLLEMIFPGLVNSWWAINLLSGIKIIGIPIEELLWHFALGFGIGSIYEVWKGLKEVSI